MRIFANKKFKRFIMILMVVIMTFNIIAPAPLVHQSHAASVGGILMLPFTALVTGLDVAFQFVLNGVKDIAYAIQGEGVAGGTERGDLFISDIVYNKLEIIDANVFNPETENPLLQTNDGDGITGIVQQWYAITRMMAIAASLVILVYVAIKILIASTGQDKAKYTELLKDWLLSLLLIFTLHYVMAAILFVSDELVKFFGNMISSGESLDYKLLMTEALAFNDYSIIYAMVWMAFLVYTLIFLILYVKRLILICFFVVISPLIVLLSTINKLRGKGSGILETWLKEFIANVAMQPIDALLFTIIGSTIFMCLNIGQPILALAFVIAFLPMRNWILKYFDQNASENKMQDAAKFAVGGAKAGVAIGGAVSNVHRKPKFDTSNIDKAKAGAKLGGSGSTGDPNGGGSVGGYAGGGASPKIATAGTATGATAGSGASKGSSTSDPSSYATGGGDVASGRVRGVISAAGAKGKSVASGVASGFDREAKSFVGSFMPNNQDRANRIVDGGKNVARGIGKGAMVGGKLLGKAAVKGAGLYAGAVMGGLSAASGGDYSKGFSAANAVTQKLAGRTGDAVGAGVGAIKSVGSKALDYADAIADGAAEGGVKGAFSGFGGQVAEDVGAIREAITTSDVWTGENNNADRVSMAEFFQDAEVVDQMYEMIETCGEGHPLYEQYQNTNDIGARRSIAQQFYMENAVAGYGVERFEDLTKRSKGSEIKAMMSVMQKQKSALTGKNAKNRYDSIKQRSLDYKS